jgi:hypothetical protein
MAQSAIAKKPKMEIRANRKAQKSTFGMKKTVPFQITSSLGYVPGSGPEE